MATQPRRDFRQWLSDQVPRTARDWGEFGARIGAGMLGGPMASIALGRYFNNGDGWNNIQAGIRGTGTSVGRMFDGNPQTGFFNNPTAPWNWQNGPSNVSQGHPDFVGPIQGSPNTSPTPTGTEGPPSPYTHSPGDPGQWGPPAPPTPTDSISSNGFEGPNGGRPEATRQFERAIRSMQAQVLGFGGRGPVGVGQGWRSYGGTGGPLGGGRESQSAFDDPFNYFSSAVR